MKRIAQFLVFGSLVVLTACGGKYNLLGKSADAPAQSAAQAQAMAAQHGWQSAGASVEAPRNTLIYFGFDQAEVAPAFKATLDAQANYLVQHPQARIRVAGHTDSRGSREYNIGLGWRRARAVVDVLQSAGVLRQQIDTQSFGSEKPMALGDTEEAYRKNRRVELTYEVMQ